MAIRTRFAPSPTGMLHIGGVRTALFSWLYARRHNGTFILRIEDTDRERSTDEATQVILDGMEWLGLSADEGPFYQTRRMDRYREVIGEFLKAGHAYHCYCSKEELEEMRNRQLAAKQKPRYDGTCRNRTEPRPGVSPVVRFKNPIEGSVVVEDVIRGDDHLNNTPRQINMLKALGAEIPVYGHVPMILGQDGAKLSKRHGAVSVLQYREEGFLPEALLNYLVRLGWSHGDQEVFSMEEMTQLFDIKDVNKSASAFNPDKLLWLNQQHIMRSTPEHVAKYLKPQLAALGVNVTDDRKLAAVAKSQQERAKTLKEMAQNSLFFFQDVTGYDEKAAKKNLTAEAVGPLTTVLSKLSALTEWVAPALHDVVNQTATELSLGMGKIAQPIRVAVSGGTVSPPIDVTLEVLGRDVTIARLERALAYARGQG